MNASRPIGAPMPVFCPAGLDSEGDDSCGLDQVPHDTTEPIHSFGRRPRDSHPNGAVPAPLGSVHAEAAPHCDVEQKNPVVRARRIIRYARQGAEKREWCEGDKTCVREDGRISRIRNAALQNPPPRRPCALHMSADPAWMRCTTGGSSGMTSKATEREAATSTRHRGPNGTAEQRTRHGTHKDSPFQGRTGAPRRRQEKKQPPTSRQTKRIMASLSTDGSTTPKSRANRASAFSSRRRQKVPQVASWWIQCLWQEETARNGNTKLENDLTIRTRTAPISQDVNAVDPLGWGTGSGDGARGRRRHPCRVAETIARCPFVTGEPFPG